MDRRTEDLELQVDIVITVMLTYMYDDEALLPWKPEFGTGESGMLYFVWNQPVCEILKKNFDLRFGVYSTAYKTYMNKRKINHVAS